MKREVVIGVASSLIGAFISFIAAGSLGLFEKQISDSQMDKIASLVVDKEEYRSVILAKMAESKRFVGPAGPQGTTGDRGVQGERGPGTIVLAAATVIDGSLKYGSSGVAYDRATGVVSFPNPNRLKYVAFLSDISDAGEYVKTVTQTHIVRRDGLGDDSILVWGNVFGTDRRNVTPSSFMVSVIAI